MGHARWHDTAKRVLMTRSPPSGAVRPYFLKTHTAAGTNQEGITQKPSVSCIWKRQRHIFLTVLPRFGIDIFKSVNSSVFFFSILFLLS